MAIVSDVEIRLRADIARLRQDMERARQEVNRPLAQMSRAVEQFKGLLAGIGAGLGISALVGQLIGAQREFDKLNASLIAVTGSSKSAKEVFAVIQEFASRTPYSVGEVTEAFLKLRNLGLTPSERALTSYGNTASAMGKDLNQLIEAVADAATGEFERLKEFGVKSKKEGDNVSFTFQGVTTTVKNSANDIEKYLMQIGEVNFAGAMALQANTLNGDISALADTWNQTLVTFNQSGFGDSAREGVTSLSGALVDLQAIMKAVAGEATKEGEAVNALGPLHQGLTMIFEALTVFGLNVAYTFQTIGKDIGVLAGQAGILFSRGLQGLMDGSTLRLVQEVGRARVAEAEEERRQVDTTSKAVLGAAARAAEARAKDAESRKRNTADVLGEYKILDAASQDYLIALKNLQDSRTNGAISEAEYIRKTEALAKQTYEAQIKREEALSEAQQKAVKKAADAREKASAATKKTEDDRLGRYAALVDAASTLVMATDREAKGLDKLTKSQEMALALDQGLATGKIKLTAAEEAYYRALIETLGANEDTIAANAKAKASAEAVQRAVEELDDSRRKTIESARTEAESAENLVATFGMTAEAIEMVTIKRLEDRLARRVDLELDEKEIAYLTELIELKRRGAQATGQLAELQKTKDMWESIEKTAHDTFISIVDGGKDAATRLKDTFKNVFFDWLYQQTLKKWIINLQGNASVDGGGLSSLASAFGGGGGSSDGSLLGNASTLLSIGKSIYSGFAGGIASSLGTTLTSMGTTFGSAAVAEFGAGMSGVAGTNLAAGSAAGAGASFANAIPVIGWIISGMMASNSLYKQGWDFNNGSVNKLGQNLGSGINLVDQIFRKLGFSNSTANILSGLAPVSKLFGRKNPEITSSGMSTTFDSTGLFGENWAKVLEKGGIFRSDKNYTLKSGLDQSVIDGLSDSFSMMLETSKALATSLNVSTDSLEAFKLTTNITWDKDATKREQQVVDMLKDVGNALATTLVPNIASFAAEGETASTTLQRLATEFANTNAIMQVLGVDGAKAFGAVGLASIEARERLIKFAGGVDALATQTDFFTANFLTEAERLAPVQKQVTERMAALGHATVDTNDEFKALVQGMANSGALATEEGAKTFAALLAIAPAFKAVADAATETAARAAQLASTRQDMEIRLMEISGDAAGALAARRQIELAAMDETLRPLQQLIYAREDEAALAATAAEKRQLEIQIMELSGDSAGALAAQRQIEMASVDASLRPLLARVHALQDLNALEEKAAQLLAARQNVQIQIMEAEGDSVGALALRRQIELAAVDESLRPLYLRLYALQDEKKATEDATAAAEKLRAQRIKDAQDALGALQRAVNAEKNTVTTAYQDVMTQLQKHIDDVNVSIGNTRDLSQALKSTLGGLSVDSDAARSASRQVASDQIAAALKTARASGVLPTAGDLAAALQTVGQTSMEDYGSYLEYVKATARTASDIAALNGITETQLTIDERQLAALIEQKDAATSQYNAEIERLDKMVTAAQQQVDALNGVNNSVLQVHDALARFNSAITGAPMPTAAAPVTGAVNWQQPSATGQQSDTMAGSSVITELQTMNQKISQLTDYVDQVTSGGNAMRTVEA
jgi:hypothetical protein